MKKLGLLQFVFSVTAAVTVTCTLLSGQDPGSMCSDS